MAGTADNEATSPDREPSTLLGDHDGSVRANILLVDDRYDNIVALEEILAPLGQNLVRAMSGEEALKCLLREDFAVVLLDVRMPGLDGLETAEFMKRRERSRHIPIIFLTAVHRDPRHVVEGYAAGAVDYLQKPFDPWVLRSKVAVFVDLFIKNVLLERQASLLRKGIDERDEIQRELLRRSAELARSNADLEQLAVHCPLTGLPNRTLFLDRVGQALARARRREGSTVAVLFLDLDHFKVINDSLGHTAGDEVLIAVAERLRTGLRAEDTVARFGGDEFVLLCEVGSPHEASSVARGLCAAVEEPLQLAGREVTVTASIGIAIASEHPSAEALVRDADAAMYRAKEQGRARWELFDEAMRRRVLNRLDTEAALRRAVEREELRLLYQPLVRLRDGSVAGLEALVRWEAPGRGLIGPADFIPLAEETGLIIPIGEWVLREACRQSVAMNARPGARPLTVSVNLSVVQLSDPALADVVARTLAETGADPSCVRLEITESAAMEDVGVTVSVLRSLKALGVGLSLDDFGTGYSSLAYLHHFPVDELKVDRSFVARLGHAPEDSTIVGVVVFLAHAVGIEAVAEGVETLEQVVHLRNLGCDLAQGYFWSEPVDAEGVVAWLGRQHPATQARSWTAPELLAAEPAGAVVPSSVGNLVASVRCATEDQEALRAAYEATRAVARAATAEEASEILVHLVRRLGGAVVPARMAGPWAVPVDLSLGVGEPVMAAADPATPARRRLEEVLPDAVADATMAMEAVGRARRLADDSGTDLLTGLPSQRAVLSTVSGLGPRDVVVLLSLDGLETLADELGAAAADAVVCAFSLLLREHARAHDSCGRLAGGGFALILRCTDEPAAAGRTERMRAAWIGRRPHPVTFSAGVARAHGRTGVVVLGAADHALGSAIAAGGGRTEWGAPRSLAVGAHEPPMVEA